MERVPAIRIRPDPFRAAASLAYRELLRFFRQRNRVIGAIGQPVIFWLLFGAGLSRSFSLSAAGAAQQTFLEYYFPGTLVLILLFTAIFASISIIEDRREGFLQSVLVSPAPAWSMVLGKVGGGAAIAFLQALFFLILGLFIRIDGGWQGVLICLGLLCIISLSLSALGFFLAWLMDSTQGFHAIMSVLLFPMWLLSGAFFPIPSASGPMQARVLHWLMRANPLSYGVAGVRAALFPGLSTSADFWQPSLAAAWGVSVGFLLVTLVAASLISKRRIAGDIL
jgi:ABC-2 type transport system permease protein